MGQYKIVKDIYSFMHGVKLPAVVNGKRYNDYLVLVSVSELIRIGAGEGVKSRGEDYEWSFCFGEIEEIV